MRGRLQECIRLMEIVESSRKSVDENQRTAKKNNIFFESYKKFQESLNGYFIAVKVLEFIPSNPDKIESGLQILMKETERIFQIQKVPDPISYRQKTDAWIKLLQEEWQNYSVKYTQQIYNDLIIAKSILPQKIQINKLLHQIEECRSWPINGEVASNCINAFREASQLLQGIELDEHILAFLNKIRTNTAVLSDITPEVMEWLQKEQFTDKIQLKFRM